MQAEIRLHDALQGLPAKDTTLRMHECPGFKHDLPIPLVKHFDFRSGFITGRRMVCAFCIDGRAQLGKETFVHAHTLAFWSPLVVSQRVQSGLSVRAKSMWWISSVFSTSHIIPWFLSSRTKHDVPSRDISTTIFINDSWAAHFFGHLGQDTSVVFNHCPARVGSRACISHFPAKLCHQVSTILSDGHFGNFQQVPIFFKLGSLAK